MRGKLFIAASALSLVLCVATMVLWVRSDTGGNVYYVARSAPYFTPLETNMPVWESHAYVAWNSRCFQIGRIAVPSGSHLPANEFRRHDSILDGSPRFGDGIAGFQFVWLGPRLIGRNHVSFGLHAVTVPIWFLVLLTATLPLQYVIHRHSPHGHCATCSYNLTGNTSGVCPECGKAVAGRARA